MTRPRPASSLMLLGGGAAAVGAVLAWATVEIDLSATFALFPPDYRQRLSGPDLDRGLALALALLMVAAGMVATFRPRVAETAAWTGSAAALAAVMDALLHLARIRVIALDALTIAAERDPSVVRGASVSVGTGTFVVMAGAVAFMAGAVLVLTGRDPGAPGGFRPGGTAGPDL